MKRNSKGELHFTPYGQPLNIDAKCLNHNIKLPDNHWILLKGLFVLGDLETNQGNSIEAAYVIPDSCQIFLIDEQPSSLRDIPKFIYPKISPDLKISIPQNHFNPYFNCHGYVFGDSKFNINPLRSQMINGQMVLGGNNLEILLEDEYFECDSQSWEVGIIYDNKQNIVHSIKRENKKICSKFDHYELIICDNIEDLDLSRYNAQNIVYYRQKNSS